MFRDVRVLVAAALASGPGCTSSEGPAPAGIAVPGHPWVRRPPPAAPPRATPEVDFPGGPAHGPTENGPDLPAADPLTGPEVLPEAWPGALPRVVGETYTRRVAGAPVLSLAWSPRSDTLLAFDALGGLRRLVRGGAWEAGRTPLPAGLTRVESAGETLLACAGEAAPATWSHDFGATFGPADFTCGQEGRRTAVLVDGRVYALLSPDTLGVAEAPGAPFAATALPAPALALAALPPVVVVFGNNAAWRSADDGRTFEPVGWPADAPLVREAVFLAKSGLLAVGESPAGLRAPGLVASADEGRTFTVPFGLPRHTERLAALAVSDTQVLAVPSGDGEALYSDDNGRAFRALAVPRPPRDAVVAARQGFAAASAETGVTGIAGLRLPPLSQGGLTSAVFTHPRIGLAISTEGHLLRTSDAGRTWRPVAGCTGLGLRALVRAGSGHAAVLGGRAGLWHLAAPGAAPRVIEADCDTRWLTEVGDAHYAGCDDASLRRLRGTNVERLPGPGSALITALPAAEGALLALGADGRTLWNRTPAGAWRSRTVPGTESAPALALDAAGGLFVVLRADGARLALSRFDGDWRALPGLAPADSKVFLALPGGGAVVAAGGTLVHLDGIGQGRILGPAPEATGIFPTGDGTLLVTSPGAYTLFTPE